MSRTCVVDDPNRAVRLDDTVVAFNDAIVSALPLRFDVAGVEVFYAVTKRVVRVLLKWGFVVG